MIGIQDHTEILQAALETLDEGVAVLDGNLRVLFWNRAAAALTGYQAADLLSRALPSDAYQIDTQHQASQSPGIPSGTGRPLLVHLRHRQGHTLPAMLRRTPLRNSMGARFGTLLRFHPADEVDALPHGAMEENANLETHVEHSQAALEDRLDEAWREWAIDGVPFGLLWIDVDQAAMLRRTHGHDASEAMLAIVERTLAHALRPAEMLGRWGTHEFLVLCHERTLAMLESHARHVCTLATNADFRWWGDRVNLTISVGAAQAKQDEKLTSLLHRARRAMQASQSAGGNTVTIKETPGSGFSESRGWECSQS
jgi:diguanylate cyclase (GGDEF)-like protein/PAS domain S-box-containing protein